MSHTYDLSFLTSDLFQVQREHERRLEQLCRGEQPSCVPTFASFVLSLALKRPCESPADGGWSSRARRPTRFR